MNSFQKENPSTDGRRKKERRMLSLAVEFVKILTFFVVIIAAALVALHFAIAAM